MKNYCRPFKRGASWRSQNFRANPNNGTNGAGGHTGNDEAAATGTPVHAAGDGVVVYAGTFDGTYADNFLWLLNFGGNILVLDCGDDEPTFVYAHLSRFRVKVGDRVRMGQVIADSGNSGTRTTGAHLHMECLPPGYNLRSPTLGRVNPDTYCTVWPEDLPTITAQSTDEDNMPITKEDARTIAEAVLNYPFDRQGPGQGGTINLRGMLEWYDANNAAIPTNVWSYRNPSGEETRDAYQVIRDIGPAAVAAQIPDDLAQDVIDALAERLGHTT